MLSDDENDSYIEMISTTPQEQEPNDLISSFSKNRYERYHSEVGASTQLRPDLHRWKAGTILIP
jgi:hypothetical protein